MAQLRPHAGNPGAGRLRTVDILGALSLAADLAVGLPEEHAIRSCYLGMRVAEHLGLARDAQADLYYATLLMDAGCTAWTSQLAAAIQSDELAARRDFVYHRDAGNPLDVAGWMARHVAATAPLPTRAARVLDFARHGKAFVQEGYWNACETAARFAQRLGMSPAVQEALLLAFEHWDGGGPHGTRGEDIPITSRIIYATSLLEAVHRANGRAAAVRLAQGRQGTAFAPAVVDAVLALARDDAFWGSFEQDSVWPTVRTLEPPSPFQAIDAARLDDVTLAFADFTDLKSAFTAGHSRRTADLAVRLARRLRLADEDVVHLRRAALLHDLGLVAAPSFTLEKPRAKLTPVEWERLRLHPYYAERILARIPALAPALPLIAAHHERLDGGGYYRGLAGPQIPLGARIIAVADRFDTLTHDSPEQPALEPERTLQRLRADAGPDLCPDAVRALAQELGPPGRSAGADAARPGRRWPADLTDREVEILRLLARGMSRRQVAAQLVLSEHTVRHHLEHIYGKAGVTTRVAATLFALEHGLLG